MANLIVNAQSIDSRSVNPECSDSEDEAMPQPWLSDLPDCRPRILYQEFYEASMEDQEVFKKLKSQALALELHESDKVQSKVQKLYERATFCYANEASEEFWSFWVIWPVLNLARKLCRSQRELLVLPLSTATVSPTNLLPQWEGNAIARKIDFGLAIKLNDDDIQKGVRKSTEQKPFNIGPAASTALLRACPLFCHIEVKKQFQSIDALVQLGIWASAVYTKWEQVAQDTKDLLPVTFCWAIHGHDWHLHMIRRLPDGSRQITANFQTYHTRNPSEIYLIIATLSRLMDYGDSKFREDFQASVLSVPAPAPTRTYPRREKSKKGPPLYS